MIMIRNNATMQNPNDAAESGLKEQNAAQADLKDCQIPWRCVSLVRTDGKTLDFTINDENAMFSFIHATFKLIFQPPVHSKFMRDFKLKKFRMKLNFEASQ